jgi:hypothetical protein
MFGKSSRGFATLPRRGGLRADRECGSIDKVRDRANPDPTAPWCRILARRTLALAGCGKMSYIGLMLDTKQIDEIAWAAANMTLGGASIVSVTSRPKVDWQGDEALEITVVLTPDAPASIGGEAVIRMLSETHNRLQEAGDDRFPFMRYATEDELKELAEADD